jgi:hypothetical protein
LNESQTKDESEKIHLGNWMVANPFVERKYQWNGWWCDCSPLSAFGSKGIQSSAVVFNHRRPLGFFAKKTFLNNPNLRM